MTEPTQPYQPPFDPAGQPAIPQPAIPQPAIPQPAVPQAATSQAAIPQPAVPQAAVPQAAVPQAAVPQAAVPQAAVPQPVLAAPPPPPSHAAPPPAPAPVVTDQRSGRGSGSVGRGTLLAAILATAVLTSAGTYVAVNTQKDSPTERPAALTGLESGAATSPAPAGEPAPTVQPAPTTPAPVAPAPATEGSVVEVVKAVSPAVVTIVAEGITSTDPITGLGGQGTATGSGVIFDADGLILTNRHVVSGNPTKLTVNLKDGRSLAGTIYGIDTFTDLAIVKVDGTGLPTAPIGDSSAIQVGQQAIAIGSPLGEFTDSVTTGIVSAIGRTIDVQDGTRLTNLIQTDTAINPGNSGGPLLDASGRVIGINTAVAGDAQGIGFAIPIDIAKPLLAQASSGQQLARAWLGIRFQTIDPALKAEAGLPVDNGAWIPTAAALAGQQGSSGQGVDPFTGGQGGQAAPQPAIVSGSPAEAAGLAEGDIITAVNGTALNATHPLDLVVSQLAPGEKASLDVLRDGQTVKLSVTLGTRPASV